MAQHQTVLQNIEKSSEHVYWDIKSYGISYASLWNSTTVITLVLVQASRLESRGQLILKVLSCTKEEHHSLLQKYFITLCLRVVLIFGLKSLFVDSCFFQLKKVAEFQKIKSLLAVIWGSHFRGKNYKINVLLSMVNIVRTRFELHWL